MNGLYALKPWYARQLSPVVDHLERRKASPDAVTASGVAFGAAGGVVLAFAPAGLAAALLVAVCVAARLACANIDGTLARTRSRRAVGGVWNELGDRMADLALLAGLSVHVPWGGFVLLAAALPSWSALAVAAAGGRRSNSGPMGKTERCAVAVLATLTGWYVVAGMVLVVGSLGTAAIRLHGGAAELTARQR